MIEKHLERILLVVAILLIPHTLHSIIKPHYIGHVYLEFTSHGLYLNEVAVLLCLIVWGGFHVQQAKQPLRLPPWWALGAWLLLLGHCLLSALWATAPWLTVDLSLRWIVTFGFCLFVLNKADDWRWGLVSLIVGMILQASLAFLQFSYQGLDILAYGNDAGGYFSNPALWTRGQGTTPHPNILGGYLAAGIPFLLEGIVTYPRWRWPLRGALGLIILGLLSTFSRTALLGLAGCAAILGIIGWRSRALSPQAWRRIGAVTGLVLMIGVVFIVNNQDYFSTRWTGPLKHWLGLAPLDANASELWNLNERAWYTQAAYEMIVAHPWRGVGAGNFTLVLYQNWHEQVAHYVYQPVHNTFLLLVSELGLSAILWWAFLLIVPVGLTLWMPVERLSLSLGIAAASLCVLCIISFFDYYLWMAPQGKLLVSFVLGRWYMLWSGKQVGIRQETISA